MSLPPVDRALLPAEVRNGSAKEQKAYAAALGFERMLLQQFTKPLAASALGSGGEDSGTEDGGQGDGSSAMYSDMLASSLADGIVQQGGTGLAQSLYRSLGKEHS
jgi:Rod binding domain-containing protein